MSTTAICEDVVFETHPQDRQDAFLIDPRSFATWIGGADVRREDVPRPNAPGSFYAPGYLAAKTVQISGKILARSQYDYERKKLLLTGMLVGRTATMTVQNDDHGVTRAEVGLSRQAIITDHGGDSYAGSFQVEVWSPDPFVYGEDRLFGPAASVNAYHRGNTSAPLSIIVPNGAASYTITSPGGTRQIAGITAGGTHVIDMRTGWITRNGVLVWGVSSGDLWEIPAGPGWVHTISTGTLQIALCDRFA